jgi:hypothetical protein
VKGARFVLTASAFLLLAGCAATAPYKDALGRIGEIGPRIAEDIKPDGPGAQARKDEFLRLCEECRRLGAE